MSARRRARTAVARLVLTATAGALGARDARATDPAVSYALNCRGCHLADGRETPDLVPPLQGSVGRFVRLPEGRTYMIRLPNVASTPLDDAETAALLTWLVRRFGGAETPRDFAPFTVEEVARARANPLLDVEGARRDLLAKLDALDGAKAVGPGRETPRQPAAETRTGAP